MSVIQTTCPPKGPRAPPRGGAPQFGCNAVTSWEVNCEVAILFAYYVMRNATVCCRGRLFLELQSVLRSPLTTLRSLLTPFILSTPYHGRRLCYGLPRCLLCRFNRLKPTIVFIVLKKSVRTWKRTPHFTITKINWLMLFKGNNSCLHWKPKKP
jgi:hypothetical protein